MTEPESDIRAVATEESSIVRRLEVEIDASRVRRAFDHAYRDLAKGSQIKGFRRGRVPRSVLERLYGASVAEQLEQTLIQETLADALEQTELQAVASPAVDSEPPKPDTSFSYVARVEVRPEIELPDLEGLPGKRPSAEVPDEDVEEELESLRLRHAPVVEEPEGTSAANGHILTVDFVGRIEGEVFEGGTGKDVEVELGASRFIPGFEEQLLGAEVGEDREVQVAFPEDYANQALAGRQAVFAVHVAEVKSRQLPELDDEFAKDLGEEFGTLAELRERIRTERTGMRKREAQNALYRSLLDALIERTEFDVPHGMVDRQLERRLENAARQFAGSMEDSALQAELERMRDQWRPAAEREVREQLLIEAVAKARGIEASELEIEERIQEMAQERGVEVPRLREALGEGVAESLASGQLRDQQALDFLAATAKVEVISDR